MKSLYRIINLDSKQQICDLSYVRETNKQE